MFLELKSWLFNQSVARHVGLNILALLWISLITVVFDCSKVCGIFSSMGLTLLVWCTKLPTSVHIMLC